MTDTHSIAQLFEAEVSPANNRQLTVSYASRYRITAVFPPSPLKGQWLEAAGLPPARGRCQSDGRLYCPHRPTPVAEESELMQSLRRCKLSARKQKQVQEFIGVIAGKQKFLILTR